MRRSTLTVISFLISVAIVNVVGVVLRSQGIKLALFGPVAHVIVAAALSPLMLLLLIRMNRPLLEWRKKRGRDIEAEESHEVGDTGIISLKPRVPDDKTRL